MLIGLIGFWHSGPWGQASVNFGEDDSHPCFLSIDTTSCVKSIDATSCIKSIYVCVEEEG